MHTSSRTIGTQASNRERRAEPRREIDVLMNRYLNGYPYLCRASDISRTGMRLHALSSSGDSTRFVGLQFQLPGCAEILTASAEVISRSREAGTLGVRFTRMPVVSKERIGRFLASEALD